QDPVGLERAQRMLPVLVVLLFAGAADDAIVRVGGSIPKPRRVEYENPSRPEPGYTPVGIVILELTVGEDGRPTDVAFVRGAGFKRSIALEAVKRWRYEPTRVEGRPVKVTFRELIELFATPEARGEFYAYAIQDKKESKGFRLFALEQLVTTPASSPEVAKAL